MEARGEGRPSAGWWADRSIRTKGLVVLSVPLVILLGILVSTAWLTGSYTYLLAIAIAGAALALAVGLATVQLFTSGVTARLRRLERATEILMQGGQVHDAPAGNDEIGRLSDRLLTAASQLHDRAEERDRVRKQLEDILTASPVVSLRYEIESRRFSYASPNVERLLGISAGEAVADPSAVIDRFHPDDAERLRDALVGAIRRHHSPGRPGAGGNRERRRTERVEMTLRFRRDPGSRTWGEAEAIYTLEHRPDGTLNGVVAYLVDASERHAAQRAAEERRSMLETIFHASPDTIVVRDVAGRIILASSTLADLIGVGEDAVGRAAGAVVSVAEPARGEPGASVAEDGRRLLQSLTTRCLAGEPTPDPVITTSRLPSGGARTFETRARAVLDARGHVIGTVTVSRDVTDRVQLEQSMRKASEETERASEAKSEFLSRMSHELRTPLNAMLGFAQLLELDELSTDQASSVDQIQRAGRHLLSLINEVLDISRIEAGRLVLAPEHVQVGDVLDEVATLLLPAAESAGLDVRVTTDDTRELYVSADRQRLLQVLLNLGSNAVKYNEPGGEVLFRTWQGADGRVRFGVLDTGPGISHEQQDELFLPFSRLGAEYSAVEGTGVGLALSKQLVELMGGSIGVESVEGRGSSFWVEMLRVEPPVKRGAPRRGARRAAAELEVHLDTGAGRETAADTADGLGTAPVAAARIAAAPATAVPDRDPTGETSTTSATGATRATGASGATSATGASGAGIAPPKGDGAGVGALVDAVELDIEAGHGVDESEREVVVLQVEDNPSNAALVARILARRPEVRLVSAGEAAEGFELAREYVPNLILLDLHLPDQPGEELLYRLKRVPELVDTKIVVVSADATPSRIRRMIELGVEGYLTKPVDVEALLRLVDLEIAVAQDAT